MTDKAIRRGVFHSVEEVLFIGRAHVEVVADGFVVSCCEPKAAPNALVAEQTADIVEEPSRRPPGIACPES